jgi:hypothetical protein
VHRFVLASLGIALAATAAAAGPVQLETAGDACGLDGLDAQIERLAPPDLASTAKVRVEVTRGTDGFVGETWFPDRAEIGRRTVNAATCDQLVDSIALVIAMALPGATAPIADPPPPVTPPPVAPPRARPRASHIETAVVANAEPAPPRDSRYDLYIAGGSSISASGLRTQLILGARTRRGASSLGVELRGDAPEDRVISPIASIQILRAELTATPCLHAGGFAGCAVASLGTFHGSGRRLYAARRAFAPLVSAGVRIGWEHELSDRLAARVYFDAQALVTTTKFDVDNMPVWESQRVEGSGGVSLLAHFP